MGEWGINVTVATPFYTYTVHTRPLLVIAVHAVWILRFKVYTRAELRIQSDQNGSSSRGLPLVGLPLWLVSLSGSAGGGR